MYDLTIICRWNRVSFIAEGFIKEFEASEVVAVLEYGTTEKRRDGYMVLEWDEPIPQDFLDRLHANDDIYDFTICRVPCSDDLERAQADTSLAPAHLDMQ